MSFDINKENKYCKIADTDSLIVSFEPILKKLYPDINILSKDECLPKSKQIQSEIRPLLNEYQSVLAKNLFNTEEHYLDLKPEYIFQSLYTSGKRRYAQLTVDKEGLPIEKFVIMGIDIAKSNFPEYFRDFGESLIKKVLLDTPKSELDKSILEFKTSINEVDWMKLIKPTGVKKIDEYIESPPPKGKIFSSLRKKCPVNTKSSVYTNDLIKYYNLDKEYPQIQVGDKIYVVYLKKNPYLIDCIALTGYNDPPVIMELASEFVDRDKLFDSIMKNPIQTLYNDLGYGTVVFNSYISDFFSFS